MAKEFKGRIELDIRDSTPDWSPYLAGRAPDGAPNVLIVLYDDTGLAAWSPFGGRIQMPTATGFPGNNTHIPMENAFQAEVLREHGWSTYTEPAV